MPKIAVIVVNRLRSRSLSNDITTAGIISKVATELNKADVNKTKGNFFFHWSMIRVYMYCYYCFVYIYITEKIRDIVRGMDRIRSKKQLDCVYTVQPKYSSAQVFYLPAFTAARIFFQIHVKKLVRMRVVV